LPSIIFARPPSAFRLVYVTAEGAPRTESTFDPPDLRDRRRNDYEYGCKNEDVR
jgi:hypothetical protein